MCTFCASNIYMKEIYTFFVSLLCPAPPVGRAFGTVNTSVSEDSAVISWEYFGHHKNVYVEYIVENSKASSSLLKHQCMSWLSTTEYV